jgi:hypothetical protein
LLNLLGLHRSLASELARRLQQFGKKSDHRM